MKPKRTFEPHLVLQELALLPGTEWAPQAAGWHLLQVVAGVGYWLHPRSNHELVAGSALVCSDRAKGVIRASQVGHLVIQFFRLQPERLTGLMSFAEQHFFEKAAAQDQFAVRFFPQTTPIAQNFNRLCQRPDSGILRLRLRMLELFVESFGDDLQVQGAHPEAAVDAKTRLSKLLDATPSSELLGLSFADLVRETRCTPRHLSRIFQQVVGMSFREKQVQIRLRRAQELLATTDSKVVEVALESGYQSPCLFNLMFKRRFGTTPGKWRDQSKRIKLTAGGAAAEA